MFVIQSNVLRLSVFVSKSLSADAVCTKFGMCLVRWCFESIKIFSCLIFVGGVSFYISSSFGLLSLSPHFLCCSRINLPVNMKVCICRPKLASFLHLFLLGLYLNFLCVLLLTPLFQLIFRLRMRMSLCNL